jgi:hypothetical protein
LNTGEYRQHLKRISIVGTDGIRRIDSLELAFDMVVAYLLDWSCPDDPSIRGASVADLTAALNALDQGRFAQIKDAIDRHVTAMDTEREAEKNATDGEKNAAAISPSPSAAIGALSGSAS